MGNGMDRDWLDCIGYSIKKILPAIVRDVKPPRDDGLGGGTPRWYFIRMSWDGKEEATLEFSYLN